MARKVYIEKYLNDPSVRWYTSGMIATPIAALQMYLHLAVRGWLWSISWLTSFL